MRSKNQRWQEPPWCGQMITSAPGLGEHPATSNDLPLPVPMMLNAPPPTSLMRHVWQLPP